MKEGGPGVEGAKLAGSRGQAWRAGVLPDPHSPPCPETITSLYKTNFRADVPFDLPEIFFFVAVG